MKQFQDNEVGMAGFVAGSLGEHLECCFVVQDGEPTNMIDICHPITPDETYRLTIERIVAP